MRYLTPEQNRIIENAIVFLAENMKKSGVNPKPVTFHSVKVGFMAYQFGLSMDAIIGGILHDLVEDSDITFADITSEFGEEVSKIVANLTLPDEVLLKDYRRKEYFSDWEKYFNSIIDKPETVYLKLIDTLENHVYLHLVDDKERAQAINKRSDILFKLAKDKYGSEQPYLDIINYYNC